MRYKRKICFITGTRADFGILTPVMKEVELSEKLELQLIVTGMHLIPQFGYTINEIRNEGFRINKKIYIGDSEDDKASMSRSVGKAISEFTTAFEELKPDLVVVLGDRGEMLAGAIAANYLEIPIAHIHGGEVSGHIDGVVRHAITKLSHLHFAATDKSRKRIIRLGEDPKRVYTTGAPALDRVLNEPLLEKKDLYFKYNLDSHKPLFLIVQHPVSLEKGSVSKKIKATLNAALSFKAQILVICPNSDAGGKQMINVIESYSKNPSVTLVKSIPHLDYLSFLKSADVLVGNSSSGIIEAPSFNLPVVNVGSRQDNRERAKNVIGVDYDKEKIASAIKKALEYGTMAKKDRKTAAANPYGDGKASRRIVSILKRMSLKEITDKKITY